MKPFNLERALAGDPVVTRSGWEIVEVHLLEKARAALKLVVTSSGNVWNSYKSGVFIGENHKSPRDLFMAPKKRTVWVNLYHQISPMNDGGAWSGYNTEEAADTCCGPNRLGGKAYQIEIEE